MNQNTIQKIVELKASGHKSIYFLNVRGLEFIFRPLTFDEYTTIKDLEGYLDGAAVNDTICIMCLVYCSDQAPGEYVSNCKHAFDVDHIAQHILNMSGFDSQDMFMAILTEKRKEASQLRSLLEIYICSAFHTLSPVDLKRMTLEELLELFAKAEEALNRPVDFNAIFRGLTEKEEKLRHVPVDPNMMSTEDLLRPDIAAKPEFY